MAHEPLLTLSDNDNIAVALQKKSNPATSSIHRVLSHKASSHQATRSP